MLASFLESRTQFKRVESNGNFLIVEKVQSSRRVGRSCFEQEIVNFVIFFGVELLLKREIQFPRDNGFGFLKICFDKAMLASFLENIDLVQED